LKETPPEIDPGRVCWYSKDYGELLVIQTVMEDELRKFTARRQNCDLTITYAACNIPPFFAVEIEILHYFIDINFVE
jgi:hypothetical protein